ncbi:MAG: hypothetical protein O2782_16075 [bacterium]|nr:hypothetical protein [bacterium]
MHIDVQYTFYAGLPYFLKEGSMEMVQDFEMNYLRDDEWVIAGHPFTQTVWMDGEGLLHEGTVPAGSENDLWGVGAPRSASAMPICCSPTRAPSRCSGSEAGCWRR